MHTELLRYDLADGIATITLDDGKVNALSSRMLGALGEALDQAERDEAVVLLSGRATTFSAGFDLRSDDWRQMLADGATAAERLLSFPQPTVAACNGNALAMAAFLLLSCDVRIGAAGDFKLGLNEVQIGLTLPYFGLAIARHRLARPWFDRCTITGVVVGPEDARAAGFLDEVVQPEDVVDAARSAAQQLAGVDRRAHAATKLRTRAEALEGVRDGRARVLEREPADW